MEEAERERERETKHRQTERYELSHERGPVLPVEGPERLDRTSRRQHDLLIAACDQCNHVECVISVRYRDARRRTP
jgi:hypothetical protein